MADSTERSIADGTFVTSASTFQAGDTENELAKLLDAVDYEAGNGGHECQVSITFRENIDFLMGLGYNVIDLGQKQFLITWMEY